MEEERERERERDRDRDVGMGIAPPQSSSITTCNTFLVSRNIDDVRRFHHRKRRNGEDNRRIVKEVNSTGSMSQGFHHQGIFGFSDGFDRSTQASNQQEQTAGSRRGGESPGVRMQQQHTRFGDPPSLVPIETAGEDHSGAVAAAMYDTQGGASMLSDMFGFQHPDGGPSATDLLASQIPSGYRFNRPPPVPTPTGDWYGTTSRQATEMFLMNPSQQQQQQQRSSSPSAVIHHNFQTTPPSGGQPPSAQPFVMEGQGLSLSLSSSLQQFEMANKAQQETELRVREGMLYYNSGGGGGGVSSTHHHHHQNQPLLQHHQMFQQSQPQGIPVGIGQSGVVGGGGPMEVVNVLRHSKYARAAQELLEEFCSVGRGGKGVASKLNPSSSNLAGGGASTSKEAATTTTTTTTTTSNTTTTPPPPPPALSAADKFEHQRRKTKLLSMLDEARIYLPSFSETLINLLCDLTVITWNQTLLTSRRDWFGGWFGEEMIQQP